MRVLQSFVAAVFLPTIIATAASSQNAKTIFGHEIYVSGEAGRYDLMIDGTSALSDGQVIIWEIGLAGDAPFVMGWTGSGGSMCPSVPFIVSFAEQIPSVDVLPIECGRLPHEIRDGEILFEQPGIPGSDGTAFLWTPQNGFTSVAASVVDPGSGWTAMRQREISAPNEFLNYPDTLEQIRALAGDGSPGLMRLISGPPDATYRGTMLITSNCVSGNCPYGGTMIVADMATRQMYLAWADNDSAPGEVRPALSEWPEELQHELASWQAQW